MKMVTAVLEIIEILFLWSALKGPYFWRRNIHIHRPPTYDIYTLKCRILIKSVQPVRL
jgi:hypothetical protein